MAKPNRTRASLTTPATAPGLERREVLLGGALALLGSSGAGRAHAPGQGAQGWTWERFLAEAPGLVAELASGARPDEHDAYLYQLASLAARIERVPGGSLRAFGGLDPAVLFGMLHRGTPFFVVEWRLEPGSSLPAHCHPGASVCTLTLEGEAEIRHYEVEPGAPAFDVERAKPFRLRETRRQRLRAGSISTLSPSRDNLHGFRTGGTGARGIDITTMHGGDGRFSFVRFDPDRPLDAKQGLHEAVWVGQEPPR